ncbi:MAG: threonine--tRNA ligase [Nitrososphaeria archaeon]|nr:threonine--tRNA ligase [Nitrososphaeria archaeon]NIN51717.1 threonine--tRNA ligase [Nitrososphaeria archaeon]NIQ32211.1 threonine--tRNA ligase [Nitrososphaeria archaeon]
MKASREVGLEDLEPGEYYIVAPGGKIYRPEDYDYEDKDFEALVNFEVFKVGVSERPKAPHINLMRKLELVNRDSYSDSGHLTMLPKGALIFDLLVDRALQIALDQGATPVHTSIMYDVGLDPIKEHISLFGGRSYQLKPAKRAFVLRYAACFGQFSLLSRRPLSHSVLPYRIFELADSYRYEQRGELLGLSRVRRFHMPDMHVLCRDLEEAKVEFTKIYKICCEEAKRHGWTYYNLHNIVEDFLKEHWNLIRDIVDWERKPILIQVIESGTYYWVINVEFNAIDSAGRPVESATVQIDIGNAERFGITYIDKDGTKKHPTIIHTAIIGSIERFICDHLEAAAKAIEEGRTPILQTWLSPTQVRFIPVSHDQISHALKLAEELNRNGIRGDVDDRDATVAKKVRYAESQWIPYVVVVGKREVESNILSVRIRASREIESLSPTALINRIKAETSGMPYRPLYYPIKLSMTTSFS